MFDTYIADGRSFSSESSIAPEQTLLTTCIQPGVCCQRFVCRTCDSAALLFDLSRAHDEARGARGPEEQGRQDAGRLHRRGEELPVAVEHRAHQQRPLRTRTKSQFTDVLFVQCRDSQSFSLRQSELLFQEFEN